MRIGIFDSGLGGLSVLRAIGRALDAEAAQGRPLPVSQLLYVADSGHAPYGEKSHEAVLARSIVVADFLMGAQGADILVIACNTATAVAAKALRETHPHWPIVGVEPGVKPAAALTRNGRIGVMATERTLASDKFRLLAQAHAAHVELALQPCPGLAAAIEGGDLDAAPLRELIADCCAPLREQGVDTVVLGCTHYPFVAHHIAAELGPDVTLIDTADAVARRTLDLARQIANTRAAAGSGTSCAKQGSSCRTSTPAACTADTSPCAAPVPAATQLELWSSGDVTTLARLLDGWLHLPGNVRTLPTGA
ncbi:MAG: glutamate racemase [Burkholderiales bacterium]|nr:glutamate racemase [Burkholderiales bacterium]